DLRSRSAPNATAIPRLWRRLRQRRPVQHVLSRNHRIDPMPGRLRRLVDDCHSTLWRRAECDRNHLHNAFAWRPFRRPARSARIARHRSALRRRPPSAIAAPPPPRLAENHSRPPSPAARPIPIFLRSSVPLPRFRSKFSQLHLSRTAPMTTSTPPQPYTADQSENSTTSVDANPKRWRTMNEAIGRLLAAGNVAEIFEWGSRVVKLYKSTAAKPAAFRETAIHAAVEALGLPVPRVWGVQEIGSRWG